jgi:enoyl-CoA hydratase/carnithine racemase
MSEHIRLERRDAILHIELNRPEKKNALTVEMYEALADAVAGAGEDPDVRALLISGAGDIFTGGNDLRDFLDRPPLDEGSPVQRFLGAMMECPQPILAAVHGLAVGIGTTMLLHCDLIYAARGASFHMPFVALGLVPEAGSSLLLPARVGYARAAELLLLGEPASADEALDMGLISRVVPEGELMDRAWASARRLADLPPEALRATKSLMRAADRRSLPDHMRRESALFLERLRSDEARTTMQRFFESRKG